MSGLTQIETKRKEAILALLEGLWPCHCRIFVIETESQEPRAKSQMLYLVTEKFVFAAKGKSSSRHSRCVCCGFVDWFKEMLYKECYFYFIFICVQGLTILVYCVVVHTQQSHRWYHGDRWIVIFDCPITMSTCLV